ncbi:hypothetical protein [Prosthecobacter sp.]|uniref:hypothetical protein n=1 Tax=Prosthecobacter sp. TaxID=1965333 RepID=UPI00378485FA
MIPRFFLPFILLISACQSKPPAATAGRDLKEEERLHKAGLVLIPDLQHASAWEKLIHADMGVPPRKIEVQAGPGFTTVIIKDLANRADAETVAQEFRALVDKQPDKFGPTKVELRLVNAAPTINPFSLPTQQAPSTVNPGSALPTLSLPPLLPSVR